MILATVSSHSCFCWLYIASSFLAAKNIINLISILPTWQCWCVESSLVLLEEGVCYDLWLWRLYGGVNGDLLHEGLCHTQVYCTRNSCSSVLLTCTYARDTQTQFCLSLCRVSGPGVHKVCLSPLSVSGKYTVWFYMRFCPSYCLAGASPLPLDVG